MSLSTREPAPRARRLDQAVRVTSPAPRDVWKATLASSANALVSQTPAWTDFACAVGRFEDASLLFELPSGRRFVLPMVRRRRLLNALTSEASLPMGWGIGGIVAPGGVQVADVAAVFAHLAGRRILRTSLRVNPLDAATWLAARPVGMPDYELPVTEPEFGAFVVLPEDKR